MPDNKATSNQVYKLEYCECEIPEFDTREIWRYAGFDGAPQEKKLTQILDKALQSSKAQLTYKIVYTKVNKSSFIKNSQDLNAALKNCEVTYLFAATIGFWIDKQIEKFAKTSATKSLIYHAIGAERIEALCDKFCEELASKISSKNLYLTNRYSPGYGDFSLSAQKEIFEILDCEKTLGVTLNESMLMSPSKSVTAIVGATKNCALAKKQKSCDNKCQNCTKINCEFRKI